VSAQDSDFYRTLTMVIVGLGVFFVIIIVAANLVSVDNGTVQSDPLIKARIDESIKPVGMVNTKAMAKPVMDNTATDKPGMAKAGFDAAAAYKTKCMFCHGTGAAGAPKLGDKAAWKARIATGMPAMLKNAINGKGGMPPKGGAADLSDEQFKSIVMHLVNSSK